MSCYPREFCIRRFAIVLVALAIVCFDFTSVGHAKTAGKRRPNIVFIMVDDMARDWVGCYGSNHKTPNIDRLASQGLIYDTAWSMPICTPTRVTLLTGQYPFHHGWITHHDVPRWGGDGLSWKKHTTFARVLRDTGYATVIGGKWQINDLRRQTDALKQHGFDEHCVWTGMEKGHAETGERYWRGYIQTNGKRTIVDYGPDAVNKYLIDFVDRHARNHKDKPFLLYYPMMLTHGPFGTTPLNKGEKSTDKEKLYPVYVDYMDKLVGRLVDAIDKAGLRENTLIIFTGDNGSSESGTLNGKPYPKGKGRHGDHGVHVPFIVRAPFLIPQAGLRCKDLIDFTDIYPTFASLAGAKVPASQKLDGISFVPSLSGDEDPFKKRNWIFAQIKDFRMIRDWQFLLDNQGGFYQIASDLTQSTNLITSNEKIIPGRRERLQMLLKRIPDNAPPPFEGFAKPAP